MDINKLIKWIDNVINEDGDKMHYGSLQTLGDIKKELRNSLNTVERNDSGGVAGGLGTANTTQAKIKPCENDNCIDYSEDYPDNCSYSSDCKERV